MAEDLRDLNSRYLEIRLSLLAVASLHQYLDLKHEILNNGLRQETRLKIALSEGILYLLPDTDVPLLDEDTGVVDGLGKSKLEHLEFCCWQIFMHFEFSTTDDNE